MNRNAIEQIYYWVAKRGNKIQYHGNGKYTLTRYRENGNKYWEIGLKDTRRHGKTIFYYSNGTKEEEIEYKNGRIHGKYLRWDTTGNKTDEYKYNNGKLIK